MRPKGLKYKINKINKGWFKKGTSVNFGRKKGHLSKEWREKISKSNLGKHTPKVILRGENHPNWRGGATPLYAQIRNSFEYRQWRSDVFTRDKFTCVKCGDDKGGNLQADHIKPFIAIIKGNKIKSFSEALECNEFWNINNGQTLCKDCHRKTKTYGEHAKNF